MSIHTIRLIMSGVFLCMSLALFLRHWLFPPQAFANYQATYLDLGAAFALLMSLWNLSRWYAARTRQQTRNLTRERKPIDAEEYNPEFDFDKK